MPGTNGHFNADELHPPQWLDEDFFSEILKQKENVKELKIKELIISPGSSKNDHYASIMFRARIKYSLSNGNEKYISMIIKTTPMVEGQKKELLEKFVLFETEIKMYAEVLPQIEKILRNSGDETKLCANLLYASLDPYKCIIFEDLCELGYKALQERHANMEEVKVALMKLAKLHAVSYKLGKEGNTSILSLQDGSFSDRQVLDIPLIGDGIKTIKKVLAKHSDLAYFIPYFEKIETKIFDSIHNSFNAYKNGERNGIFVLNHGDFHFKNMMIKENRDGKLEDLILVDYQGSVFGSPALDIMYAFIMLFSPEMRLKHRDELIYFYFENFEKTLKSIEFKEQIPKLIDLQMELLKHSHWELFLTVSFLIFNYAFAAADGDINKSVEDENCRIKNFDNPDLLNELRILLPQYLYKGYFDF